jgi:flagellar basal-body rod protein FlgG
MNSSYALAATMVNQLNRVDVLSNNLANSNTVGFKEDKLVEGSFNHYLAKTQETTNTSHKQNILRNTIPKIDGNYVNTSVGSVTITGNQLDFAINDKDSFFKVRNANNDIVLTRDGSLKNMNGFLSTSDGQRILNLNNEPIAIVDGFENQISLMQSSYDNLDKIGNNNYAIVNNNLTKTAINTENILLQGSIERSNVNSIGTMVALIDSQRRLEQAQKAIRGLSEMSEKLMTKIGSR